MDRAKESVTSTNGTHRLELTAGGALTIIDPLEPDDEYRLMYEQAGVFVTLPLSGLDVLGLRALSGDVVMARAERST